MPTNEYVEPNSDYVAESQVTPTIFNVLGQDVKYLYELRCGVEKSSSGVITQIVGLVFLEE